MEDEMLDFVKSVSNADRLRLIGLLTRKAMSAGESADALEIPIKEAYNHLAMLERAGILIRDADDHYSLDTVGLDKLSKRQLEGTKNTYKPNPESAEEVRRALVANLNPDGTIRHIPNSRTPQFRIILNYLVNAFETGRDYTEKEVNAILKKFNEDVSGLRRDLVDAGMLARERDGSRYWRVE